MNCSENENVCSVKKENNLGYYRLHTIWRNDGFFLNIASKDGAWRGEMTSNNVKEMSEQLSIEPECYLKQCKEALTVHDGQPGMCYIVENGYFTWKKIIDEDSGIKYKMGSVLLEPANFIDTIQNLVSAALECNKKLSKELNDLSQEKEKNVSNINELLKKLDDLTITKETMENDLYVKFLLLLNTKKKKIEELENIISDMTKDSSRVKHNTSKVVKASQKNPYDVETESDESNESLVLSPTKPSKPCKETKPSRPHRETKAKKTKGRTSSRNSPLLGESLNKRKKESNTDDSEKMSDPSDSDSSFESKSIPKPNPSQSTSKETVTMPSTKDELLDFFYGSS